MVPSLRSPFDSQRSASRARRRTVLAVGTVAGLLVPLYFLLLADVSYLARDFRAYHAAAEAALAGEPFVGAESGRPGAAYVYPPIAVLLFLPQAAAGGFETAFLLQTGVNLAAAIALAGLTVHWIERRRSRRLPTIDRLLVAGFVLGAAPSVAVFGQGQVDLLIALALAVAFVGVEREREWLAGAALGGAALVKLFPAVLGLWLVRRRSWRALASAIATGLAGLAFGALLFGVDAYRRYRHVLAERSRLEAFAGTVSPDFFAMSLYRPLSQLLPELRPIVYLPLAALSLAPVVAVVARRGRRDADRLATYLVAVIGMVLVSPASNSLYVVYAFFPLLGLLYLGVDDRSRLPLLAGTAAIAVPVQPAQIGAAMSAVGTPAPVHAAVLDGVRSVLTVCSVPLLGLLAVLLGCLVHATRGRHRPADAAERTSAD